MNERFKELKDSIGQEKNIIITFGDDFNEPNQDIYQEVIDYFAENPEIAAIYTDYNFIIDKNGPVYGKTLLPAWNRLAIISGQMVIQQPFFVKFEVLNNFKFNERLEHLYFFDMLRNISNNDLVSHLPILGFNVITNDGNLEQDIKILQGG